MNKKMIIEYLKTIVFAVVTSVAFSLLLCYLLFFSGIGENKSNPEYWIESIENYITYENDEFIVDETALSMFLQYNSWIQILDENGDVVYAKFVPEDFAMNLTNLKLLNNVLGADNIPGYTLYAMELLKYPGFGVLIGCDSEIVSKYSITIAGSGTLLIFKCALVFLITMILVIIYASFCYSKRVTAPVTQVLTDIEKISEGKNIEINSKQDLFYDVFFQLQKLQNLLNENEHMRNTWVVNISHDIKTPLATVRGYAEVLMSDSYDLSQEEINNFASEILNAEGCIEGLVEDLSISHRLAEGSMTLQKTTIAVKQLLEETLQAVSACGKTTDNVTITYDGELYVEGDSRLLKRSLVNIICNAFVHNDDNVQVYVNVKEMDERVIITVEDDGKGVSGKDLKCLFDRYYRGTNSANTQGTGLGLAIAKEVILAHEGTISAEHSLYGGLKFVLILRRKI